MYMLYALFYVVATIFVPSRGYVYLAVTELGAHTQVRVCGGVELWF